MSVDSALRTLKEERVRLERELVQVNKAITALETPVQRIQRKERKPPTKTVEQLKTEKPEDIPTVSAVQEEKKPRYKGPRTLVRVSAEQKKKDISKIISLLHAEPGKLTTSQIYKMLGFSSEGYTYNRITELLQAKVISAEGSPRRFRVNAK